MKASSHRLCTTPKPQMNSNAACETSSNNSKRWNNSFTSRVLVQKWDSLLLGSRTSARALGSSWRCRVSCDVGSSGCASMPVSRSKQLAKLRTEFGSLEEIVNFVRNVDCQEAKDWQTYSKLIANKLVKQIWKPCQFVQRPCCWEHKLWELSAR